MAAVTYVSLGSDCQAAGLLQGGGLRQLAFPFDWLVSPQEGVLRCIADDFAGFLRAPRRMQMEAERACVADEYNFRYYHAFRGEHRQMSDGTWGDVVLPSWQDDPGAHLIQQISAGGARYLRRVALDAHFYRGERDARRDSHCARFNKNANVQPEKKRRLCCDTVVSVRRLLLTLAS